MAINKDAGRGNWLIVMLRLEGGEELPFVVDTGTADTFLDKSLEPKLGKRRGTTTFSSWGVKSEASAYAAPQLHLDNTPLMKAGSFVFTTEHLPKAHYGRPIMGVLGMDCLRHYCVQFDFQAGKMRLLDPASPQATGPGQAFPLSLTKGRPFIQHPSLLGGPSTNLLVDSGFDGDGALSSDSLQEILERRSPATTSAIRALGSGWTFVPETVWDGATFTNLTISDGGNLIGLRFLARHLVTLNFPKRTMYLERTSIGPLVDEEVQAATEFLKDLKEAGRQPGWSTEDKGQISGW